MASYVVFVSVLMALMVHVGRAQQWRNFPTKRPTASPTVFPTLSPATPFPTSEPSGQPTGVPVSVPSGQPTTLPSGAPSGQPSSMPSAAPTITQCPTIEATEFPSSQPSGQPSSEPTLGDPIPTMEPTSRPSTVPSTQPSGLPSATPSVQPSGEPSAIPSSEPTGQPSGQPTGVPHSDAPSSVPTSSMPTNLWPTSQPSSEPSGAFRAPTSEPSGTPSSQPSGQPTQVPVGQVKPTSEPSGQPSGQPTSIPTSSVPTSSPTRAVYAGIDVNTGSVVVDTKDTGFCQPVHFTMYFTFTIPINTPVVLSIVTPGLTNGPCVGRSKGLYKTVGEVITDGNDDYFLEYVEGNYQDDFATSQFVMRTKLGVGGQLDDTTTYSVTMDRDNGFKFYCQQLQDWTMKLRGFGETQAFTLSTKLSLSTSIAQDNCFWKVANLTFDRATPQFPTSIQVTMVAGWKLATGTKISIAMPYFSNYQSFPLNHRLPTGQDGTLIEGGDTSLSLTYTTNSSWSGQWVEGSPTDKFAGSVLELTTNGPINSHQRFVVTVPVFPNAISPVCGRLRSSPDFTFAVESSTFDLPATTFDYTSPIGTGCSAQNDCNGNGECDYCTSQCKCFEGFGSDADKLTTNLNTFAADCSSRRCPLGISGGNIASANTSMHSLRECSNNGMCDRYSGTCSCFEGYTGAACSRRTCPGRPFCSARGSCLPMRHLAKEEDYFALQDPSVESSYTAQRYNVAGSWDADVTMGCVCDSGWAVGYARDETQVGEYFGPACELRRCPSGDDPQTTHVDETDCSGKVQKDGGVDVLGSGLTGAAGNLCHVDCSNRGLCDFQTGTCRCFPGYSGSNCGAMNTDAYANGYSRTVAGFSADVAAKRQWQDILGYSPGEE